MTSEHEWFIDHIEDAINGSISESDRARFDAHKNECESCAAEFAAMLKLENDMSALFATVQPASSFETNLIARFRQGAPRLRINPMIFRAAGATAAAVLLASVGFVVSDRMAQGTLPFWGDSQSAVRSASNLRQMGQARLAGSSNESTGETGGYEQAVKFNLQPDFARFEFAGGANTNLGWKDGNSATGGRKTAGYLYGTARDQNGADFRNAPEPGAASNSPAEGGTAGRLGLEKERADRGEVALGRRQVLGDVDRDAARTAMTRGNESDWYKTAEVRRELGEVANKAPLDAAKKLEMPAEKQAPGLPVQLETRMYFRPGDDAQLRARVSTITPNVPALQPMIAGVPVVPTGQPADQLARLAEPTSGTPTPGAVEGKPGAPTDPAPADPATAGEQSVIAGKPISPETQAAIAQRKVIRNGEMEFEVASFDSALMTVSKIAAEEGGMVATTNSEKLPNGKVKGTITLRVPPEHLDMLVMKLRALGELKRQNLTAQDITKEYYDISSELRAAKAMQDRLIEIIKSGNGAIKDLLSVEKELAIWRGKLEKLEGEIRYFDNLVSLSTLNISVYEKDVKSAAVTKQTENVDLGVECENVEQARTDALKAIEDAKGRVIESELKKFEAGQFGAKIVADVSPDNAGAVIDRMKQLGKVARLEIQHKQTTPDGQTPLPGSKVEKGETRIVANFYNLANVQPRQTVNLSLACDDVEAVYAKILKRVEDAGGRIVSSNLNREKPNQTTGTIQFEVKGADAEPVLLDVRAGSETMRMIVTENPDAANVTTAKRGFAVSLASTVTVPPRETASINAASTDVPAAHKALLEAATAAGARILSADLNEADRLNVTGNVDMEIRREKLEEINKVLTGPATIVARTVQRSSDIENTLDTKVRLQVKLLGADQIPARQVASLGIEVGKVENSVAILLKVAGDAGGKVLDSSTSTDAAGQTVARVVVEMPLSKFDGTVIAAKQLGKVRVEQSSKNAQVPETNLSRGRVEVTLANAESIVTSDSGLWASIRKGLGTSFSGLMWSLQLIIIGVCLVAPWAFLLWAGWKFWKRNRRKPVGAVA